MDPQKDQHFCHSFKSIPENSNSEQIYTMQVKVVATNGFRAGFYLFKLTVYNKKPRVPTVYMPPHSFHPDEFFSFPLPDKFYQELDKFD